MAAEALWLLSIFLNTMKCLKRLRQKTAEAGIQQNIPQKVAPQRNLPQNTVNKS